MVTQLIFQMTLDQNGVIFLIFTIVHFTAIHIHLEIFFHYHFQTYKKEGESFVPTYIDILAAGGSKKPELLLKEYGFDISKAKFWQDGFDYIKNQVNTLSKL